MRVHCLQHASFEKPGRIAAWAGLHKHSFLTTRLDRGEPLPPPDAFDLLVVMGGPMSVHDEKTFPWLLHEKRYLDRFIDSGKPVLGICLGSQLIAEVLGAAVTKNPEKEIGWFSVKKTGSSGQWPGVRLLPAAMEVFHWHGETFTLPPGSTHLWRSDACEHQGFVFADRVLGLQFHLEVDKTIVDELVAHCGNELVEGRWIQSADTMLSPLNRFSEAQRWMDMILDALASGIPSRQISEGGT